MVYKMLNAKVQKNKEVSVCSKEYIYWIKMMLKKKVNDSTGFSDNLECIKKSGEKFTKNDIKNCKKLSAFFNAIDEYATKGYISRYYKEGEYFLDIRYYIYFEGIIFVLQKKLVEDVIETRIYEATDIDVTSSWRDVIIFNDVVHNVYPDEIKYRIAVFEEILNNEDMIEKIKSESLYEGKKYLIQKINEKGDYKIPIKSILIFLLYVKNEL